MYSNQSSKSFINKKAASFILAVLLFLSPFSNNVVFANTTESDPWVYDTARVDSSTQTQIVNKSGDYQDSYNITVPKGVNGLTPKLSLNYSSQRRNYGSEVGYGWILNNPFISRVNKAGVGNMYTRDDYISSFDDELVSLNAGLYQPRIDNGDFVQYVKIGDVWRATTKQGLVFTFGSTTSERQTDPDDGSRVYKWLLSDITDKDGNKITYTYIKSGGNVYIDTISYDVYEINFLYSSSSDPHISNQTGFSVSSDYILDTIKVKFNGDVISRYLFQLDQSNQSSIYLLTLVTNEGYDSNQVLDTSLTKYFEYSEHEDVIWTNDSSIATTSVSHLYLAENANGPLNYSYNRSQFQDLNGDSLTDWIMGSKVYLNTGSGWETVSSWADLPVSNFHVENRMADINGDLLPDIVSYKKVLWHSYFNKPEEHHRQVWLNQ